MDTYTKPSLLPSKRFWFPANLGLGITRDSNEPNLWLCITESSVGNPY